MREYTKILTSRTKIRFQDCDPYGHLNNSNYISYFFNHREDVLKDAYEFDLFKLTKVSGKAWLVAQNQIAYLEPASVMEEVLIESQLIGLNTKVLKVEMRMYDRKKERVKALLWSSLVHYDLKVNRSISHEPDLQRLFESVLAPVSQNLFDERVNLFRMATKSYQG